jgi:hypothetical protein
MKLLEYKCFNIPTCGAAVGGAPISHSAVGEKVLKPKAQTLLVYQSCLASYFILGVGEGTLPGIPHP